MFYLKSLRYSVGAYHLPAVHSAYQLRAPTTWLSRFTGYLQRVLTYEEPAHQARARTLIPFAKLHSLALQRLKAQKEEEEAAAKQGEVYASKSTEAQDKVPPLVTATTSGTASVGKEAVEKVVDKEGAAGTNKNAAKPFDHNVRSHDCSVCSVLF